jgi:hypothetical protein
MNKEIGKITKKIIKLLNLSYTGEIAIYIGTSNLEHMQKEHPEDFKKYGAEIEDIIKNPTYLARNEKKQSVEFIKEYKINGEFVLVAVRVSGKGKYFARTMYIMDNEKVEKYFKHNYFYKFELENE